MKVLDRDGREKVTPGFPLGGITLFSGSAIPVGWALCDGTGGTPDLRDRFIIGDTVASAGTSGGTRSPTAAFTHTTFAVANHTNHAVTQPSPHDNHVVTQATAHTVHSPTQPGTHATHGSTGVTNGEHTHNAHTTATRTPAGVAAEVSAPTTHNVQGGHSHDAHPGHTGMAVSGAGVGHINAALDAHSAHTAAAVDAHSAHGVTQAAAHSTLKHYLLAYVMRVAL